MSKNKFEEPKNTARKETKKSIEDQRLKLDLIHCFGSLCSNGYRNSVGIMEEDGYSLIYPVGKYIAIKQHDKNEMAFIKLSENIDKIVSLAISPNKKFIAVCEKLKSEDDGNKKCPQVAIYNIKSSSVGANLANEKKQFNYADTTVENFQAMAFSYDSRFIACLTEAPEYRLVFIDILANKKDVAGVTLRIPITKVSISPKDNHMVAISGLNCFKILRVQKSAFVYIGDNIKRLPQTQNFTDHIWFEENKIALCNDQGQVYIIQDNEVKQYIVNGFEKEGVGISCMASFTKGLILANETGLFSVWMKDEDSDNVGTSEEDYQIAYVRSWTSDRGSGAVTIEISKNDDLLVVGFKNNDIATFDLQQIIPQVPETIESLRNNTLYMDKKLKFDYIYNGFHFGPITMMDICLQRPLIATCCQRDSTIRIWNYMNYRCELARKFVTDTNDKSPLLSMSFHPTGYYLAAGFIDKLRIYHVLQDELRTYKELGVKNCTVMKFSTGGQFLAIAYPKTKNQSNQYSISIYNSYTLQPLITLNGPPSQVTEIVWGPFDEFLLSCSLDGTVYRWVPLFQSFHQNNTASPNLNRSEKKLEKAPSSVKEKYKYTGLIYNSQTNLIWATGGDENKGIVYGYMDQHEQEMRIQQQQQFGNQGLNPQSHFTHQVQDMDFELKNYRITHFCFIQSFYNYYGIVAGTNTGAIKVFSHHFSTIPYETIQTHNGQVTQVRSSPDGRYVFSSGEDGSIFIFQVSEISKDLQVLSLKMGEVKMDEEAVSKMNPRAMVVDEHLSDVVMVYRSDVESYIQEQEKITNEYKEFKGRMNDTIEQEKRILEFKMNKMKENFESDMTRFKRQYEDLQSAKSQMESDYKQTIINLEEKHLKGVEELESLYERKLAFENEKYFQQEQELKEERLKFEKKIKELSRKQDTNIDILKKEFNLNFGKAQKVYESTKMTAEELKKVYEERLSQQEEEHESEIRNMVEKNEKELERWKQKVQDLKHKKNKLKNDLQQSENDQKEIKKKEEEKDLMLQECRQKLKEAQGQIEIHKAEYRSLEEILKKKEKKMQDYKYKISDLQKSKHVLSFRTTEMRKSLEPKEAQIEKLKEELFRLEGEFEGMLQQAQKTNEEMKKMQNHIENLKRNLKAQQEATRIKDSLNNKMIMDIYNCVNNKDMKEWASEMQKLNQIYVKGQEIKQSSSDDKGLEEMQRQIQHLEKSIYQLNKSSEKVIIRRDKEIYKKTKENAELIHEINEMRKTNKLYVSEITNLRTQLDNNKKENNNVRNELNRIKVALTKKQKELQQFEDTAQDRSPLNPFDSLNLETNKSSLQTNHQHSQSLPKLKPISSLPSIIQNQRGKIIKGLNFDSKTLATFDKAKMMDLLAEMELSTQKLVQQEIQIKTLRGNIKKHIETCSMNDPNLKEAVKESHINLDLLTSSNMHQHIQYDSQPEDNVNEDES
ncbi:WD domain, G-beta repeat protein (macronuclear) [Tetrahymena thermophila SB210]|uniref:WD domain, G-beta repeat protein n=1 Tax=Tetrahymena thermophila (strain SB210) TaxID=312017 RepID=Q22RW0_TETTS|nr:WD domain, G-beta repeat protein [Tetrahymena thermophila SB210]EAR88012.2 WD domain, G-beta repeat protein [Tetrahymena thermophila SB210]|eukprot:XP_001008257.2 WD domain, G-beta repeat protein [Tetrahymena thermophila SB210]